MLKLSPDASIRPQKRVLDNIQNEAAKIATGVTKLVSLTYLDEGIGSETLSERRGNLTLTLLYTLINNLTPIYLSSIIATQVILILDTTCEMHIIIKQYEQKQTNT